MQMTNTLINILDDDFEMPSCNNDLSELIDSCIDYYQEGILTGHNKKLFREKLNELIDEINDRRNFKAFLHVR